MASSSNQEEKDKRNQVIGLRPSRFQDTEVEYRKVEEMEDATHQYAILV